MMRLFAVLLCAVVLVPAASAQPAPQDRAPDDEVRQHLRTRIEAQRRGLDALAVEGETAQASAAVQAFYEDRQFAPVWVGPSGPTPAVDRLLTVLERADQDGLPPAAYHVDDLQALLNEIRAASGTDAGRLADLELLSTDAFLLYGSHLLTGRVSPTELEPSWNVEGRRGDLVSVLREAARTGAVAEALQSLRPPQSEYAHLKTALQRYRRLATRGGWPAVPDGESLKLGAHGPRVDSLRRRLAKTDDLTAERSAAPDSFGVALETAVVTFQERHGLEADGVVGPATRAALNVPADARAEQVAVNLERWRWLPQSLGRRHVLVNIAAFRLRVVEEGEDVLRMRAIIGRPYRQTPVFSGAISYLVLNPYWHVPHSIATKDKLPEIKKDPDYLARQQFEVLRGWGADAQPIDPSTIDWSRLSASNFPYRLRQRPGPLNALGQVKFMFPNRHSVYLHDTPTRGLFARAERSFSSGCVRVEKPIELAEYLLANQTQWAADRIQTALNTSAAERSVFLPEPVPVHLQYWTAWADADGTVNFRADVYQRDDAVYRALSDRVQ